MASKKLSVPEQHWKRIAIQTLKYSDAGARIMGGMTKRDAREYLRSIGVAPPYDNATLANGEEWELRGSTWHMLGGEDYSPLAAEHFESYARTIQIGEDRRKGAR